MAESPEARQQYQRMLARTQEAKVLILIPPKLHYNMLYLPTEIVI